MIQIATIAESILSSSSSASQPHEASSSKWRASSNIKYARLRTVDQFVDVDVGCEIDARPVSSVSPALLTVSHSKSPKVRSIRPQQASHPPALTLRPASSTSASSSTGSITSSFSSFPSSPSLAIPSTPARPSARCCVRLPRKSVVWENWQKERILFAHNKWWLLLGIVWQYVHSVSTNVAYWFHSQREPLQDMGFLLFPAMPRSWQIVSEIMFFVLLVSTILFTFSFIFRDPRGSSQTHPGVPSPSVPSALSSASSSSFSSPASAASTSSVVSSSGGGTTHYTALIMTRYFKVLIVAQTLRMCCFLLTSLPGPNYHCRPGSLDYSPPKTAYDIFGRQDAFTGCGDLVFSSHTIFATLCALTLYKYCESKFVRHGVPFLVLLFGIAVVSARKHYSLDIVVAWYTVTLLWLAADRYWPDSLPPEFFTTYRLISLDSGYLEMGLAASRARRRDLEADDQEESWDQDDADREEEIEQDEREESEGDEENLELDQDNERARLVGPTQI